MINTILVSATVSFLVSVFIGNVVGCYYLTRQSKRWDETLQNVLEKIEKIYQKK